MALGIDRIVAIERPSPSAGRTGTIVSGDPNDRCNVRTDEVEAIG